MTFVQTAAYGELVARPTSAPLAKKSTFVMRPSASLALAVSAMFAGRTMNAPLVGVVSVTAGDWLTMVTTTGVEVVLELGEGLTHVWQLHPHLPESTTAVEQIARFVASKLA